MKKALVLLNMGGPNSLKEVELFLKNMFNDKNIITVKNSFIRSLIAFMIVNSRKKEAQENYKNLGGKSPIIGHTKRLIEKLQNELKDTYVTYAMRYTPPFAKDVIKDIKERNITQITLIPLYPHYSTTTTKSSLEDFYLNAKEFKLNHIEKFYENKNFNRVLIKKIKDELKEKDSNEYNLIFSVHSLPQKIIDRGDPYQKEILSHVELLKKELKNQNLNFKSISLAYQSKLGPVKWLKPSLEEKLKSFKKGKVIISPISFTIDNSETEFELNIEYNEIAKELKITDYLVAKCPNDDDDFVNVLISIFNSFR